MTNRRTFLCGLTLGTLAAPLAAEGQQAAVPAVGVLSSASAELLIVQLAARHSVPTIYYYRGFALAGGLISYGATITTEYRTAGLYTGRLLSGAKPSNLPIVQPTKVELMINLKAAKALGLTIPQSILMRADEVIQ